MKLEKIILYIDSDLKEISSKFIAKRQKEILFMWKHLEKQDFESLEILGHRLNGNSSGYGFDRLGELGVQIENGAKVKDSIAIKGALQQIDDYLARIEIHFVAGS